MSYFLRSRFPGACIFVSNPGTLLGVLMPRLSLTSIFPPQVAGPYLSHLQSLQSWLIKCTDLEPCRCDLHLRTPRTWSLGSWPLPGGPGWFLAGLSDTTCGMSAPLGGSPAGGPFRLPSVPSFLSLCTGSCWWAPNHTARSPSPDWDSAYPPAAVCLICPCQREY